VARSEVLRRACRTQPSRPSEYRNTSGRAGRSPHALRSTGVPQGVPDAALTPFGVPEYLRACRTQPSRPSEYRSTSGRAGRSPHALRSTSGRATLCLPTLQKTAENRLVLPSHLAEHQRQHAQDSKNQEQPDDRKGFSFLPMRTEPAGKQTVDHGPSPPLQQGHAEGVAD
jgi:hypothetical protein